MSERRRQAVEHRRDFQPIEQPLSPSTQIRAKDARADIMYRDRLLSAVHNKIDPKLFIRLDERTQVRLGSIAPKTKRVQYADSCGYVDYCVRERLSDKGVARALIRIAKKGGMAELTQQLGWQLDNLLEDFSNTD